MGSRGFACNGVSERLDPGKQHGRQAARDWKGSKSKKCKRVNGELTLTGPRRKRRRKLAAQKGQTESNKTTVWVSGIGDTTTATVMAANNDENKERKQKEDGTGRYWGRLAENYFYFLPSVALAGTWRLGCLLGPGRLGVTFSGEGGKRDS